MKFVIADRDKDRKEYKKYKKYKAENALLKQELNALKKILVKVSNLVQPISVIQSIAQSRKNRSGRKNPLRKRKNPSKRLHHCRHRSRAHHRLSSSSVQHDLSKISFKSFNSTEISSIQVTMNSSVVTNNLSDESEVCIDPNAIKLYGRISPTDSDNGSIYFTAKSSRRSSDDALEFYEAFFQQNDSYDADAEMSNVLLHGDKAVNELNMSDANDSSRFLLLNSQSAPVLTDLSFQSPYYVTQQSSDFFHDFSEVMCTETNNNEVTQDIHQLKNQQQNTVASANSNVVHDDIGDKSSAQVPKFVNSSVQQHSVEENDVDMVTQNTEHNQNESNDSTTLDDYISMIEQSTFEYQSDSNQSEVPRLPSFDQLVRADATEIAPFLFPQYPNVYGASFLNTSSAFNYRSPQTNEMHNIDTSIIGTHDPTVGDCIDTSSMVYENESTDSQQPVSFIDDSIGGELLDLAKDFSSSSSFMLDESNVSRSPPYENIFNTSFMQQTVAYFAQETASEFSIGEYLPADLNERELVVDRCSCCLCLLREKNGSTLDVCIRKHPGLVECQQLRTKNTVCSACIDSMALISKKTKAKQYQCVDDSCAENFKTLKSLHRHYLKHLKCKMYICSICQKAYNSIDGLKTHERNHAKH